MKERQSNMELLRIIATMMILMLHFSGWLLSFTDVHSYWYGGTAMAVTRATLNSISYIGVVLFVLISGYFSIRPKLRSILNLFTCLAFCYVGTYLLNCWVTGEAVFQHHRLLRSLMVFSHDNWFIQCYLFLILLSPVLNAFVEKVSEKSLLVYTLVFMAFAFYFGCVQDAKWFNFNKGYSINTMIMIYLIGRYIRLYGEERLSNVVLWKIALVWVVGAMLMGVSKLYAPEYEIYWTYCSPFHIITAVAFFLLFTRVHFQNKIINWTGASCLAAYILHIQQPIIGWIINIDKYLLDTNNALLYFSGGICVVLCVFVIAIIFDKLRILVSKPIIDWVDSVDKFQNRKIE